MRGKYLRGFGHLALAGLLIAGSLTLFCGTPAQAQRRVVVVRTYRPFYRPWRGYRPFGDDPYFDYYSRYGQYVFNSSHAAYSHGYKDRMKNAASEGKQGRSVDSQKSHPFHEAGF